MSQLFQVLRCYKCSVFQVHQSKKSHKFECKMCSEKQSIKRHYGLGTAKDCRMHVQKLNGVRGENMEHTELAVIDSLSQSSKSDDNGVNIKPAFVEPVKSKWSEFVDKQEVNKVVAGTDEPMFLGNAEVVLQTLTNRHNKRKFKCPENMLAKRSKNTAVNDLVQTPEIVPGLLQQTTSVEKRNIILSRNDKVLNKTINLAKPPECPVAVLNKGNIIAPKTFPAPTVKSNSKWAQFVETEEICKENEKKIPNIPQDLFALCDDADLDNILDI